MPNMRLIIRDRAHIIRNSTRDPLLADATFNEFWEDMFNSKHALVPDLRNSDEWREKLLICQRAVLSECGVQGGGVSVVSRVMSFAKQRFDSCATPQRQFCCLLAALAMVLAYQASDSRNTSQTRQRSARRLRELPRHVLTAGLSASYSEECIRLVRIFDVNDHDPAATSREKHEFARRMSTLFFDGHIFVDPKDLAATVSSGGSSAGVSESRSLTCLSMVLQQAKATPTIYYGDGQAVHLYTKPSKETMQNIANSVHSVVETMLDRLDAELPPDNLDMLFSIFDLRTWLQALQSARTRDEAQLTRMRRHARKYTAYWNLDAVGVRELEAVACILCHDEERHMADEAWDNRLVWSKVLETSFAQKHSDAGKYQVLPDMVRVYLAAMDTTGPVERGLGKLSEIFAARSGPMDENGEHMSELVKFT